jgi:hypothetical protein
MVSITSAHLLDGDGVPDLVGLQYSPESFGWRERLHRFRGTAMEAAATEPVTPQEEPVEWVSYNVQGGILAWANRIDPSMPRY